MKEQQQLKEKRGGGGGAKHLAANENHTTKQRNKNPLRAARLQKKPHTCLHVTSAEVETTCKDGSIAAGSFPLHVFKSVTEIMGVTSTQRIPAQLLETNPGGAHAHICRRCTVDQSTGGPRLVLGGRQTMTSPPLTPTGSVLLLGCKGSADGPDAMWVTRYG